jgi:hypothetical protein
METTRFAQLVNYFENIARQHVAIQHTDKSKHFYRFEIDEMLTGLKNINYPALILEAYAIGFTDNGSDNVLKDRKGAFTLMGHVSDSGNYQAIHELWDELETIADDILARIRADKRNPAIKVVKAFDIASVEGSIISNQVGKDYGLRFEFTLTSPAPLDVDPTRWLTTSGSNGN